ncbi:MAG TPA: TPM domain-containing protein [Candidatus Binatia bacterium]|nr:TPM domain-containing protein [Candidatus Binatia bacterium]
MSFVQLLHRGLAPRTHPPLSRFASALILVLAVALPAGAQKPEDLKPQGNVNDFANLIDAQDSSLINQTSNDLANQTGDHLLVVTVSGTGNLSPAQFAEALRISWNTDPRQRERTVVILVTSAGRLALGIGSDLDNILTGPRLNEMASRSTAAGGSSYGHRLSFLTKQVADAIRQGSGSAGATSPSSNPPATPPSPATSPSRRSKSDPVLISLFLGMAVWLVILTRSAVARQWNIALLLQLFPVLLIYFLLNMYPADPSGDWMKPIEHSFYPGLVIAMWLFGGANALVVRHNLKKRDAAAAAASPGIASAAAGEIPLAPAGNLDSVSPAQVGRPASFSGLRTYFLLVGLFGLRSIFSRRPSTTPVTGISVILIGLVMVAVWFYLAADCENLLRTRPSLIKAVLWLSSLLCALAALGSISDEDLGIAALYAVQLVINLLLVRRVTQLSAALRATPADAGVSAG